MPLESKVALITGSSSGIGEATARALARKGARLVLVARRRERLEDVAARIRDSGGAAEVVAADIRSEDEVRRALDRACERWGRLDILVNSAGIVRSANCLDGATEDWRALLEINVLALAVASREAIRRFGPRGGHIVNVASLSAHRVPPKGGFYPATKFAVRALTEALRAELLEAGNPTRVSEVSPGFVATELVEGYREEERRRLRDRLEKVRILDAEDVARSIVHILEAPEHVAIQDVLLRSREQAT